MHLVINLPAIGFDSLDEYKHAVLDEVHCSGDKIPEGDEIVPENNGSQESRFEKNRLADDQLALNRVSRKKQAGASEATGALWLLQPIQGLPSSSSTPACH